jgi:hypothetical protein
MLATSICFEAEVALFSKTFAPVASVAIIDTAFDLQISQKSISLNMVSNLGSRCCGITFLALHRLQAEFFSALDDPCGFSTNIASFLLPLLDFQCNMPNILSSIFVEAALGGSVE